MEKILVIGANGQIGSELAPALADTYGAQQVWAADISPLNKFNAAQYLQLDVMKRIHLIDFIDKKEITQVYQLAAMLSATGESSPLKAWELNMEGLINLLEIGRLRKAAGKPLRIFWPSSIAAFGPNTPRKNTAQMAVMDPTSIYGISKLAGERLCEYYFLKYGIDVRSIRYPGIISYKSPPGGGTTDYAIGIFHAALKGKKYSCFLAPDSTLPMIYMSDAIRATLELMQARIDDLSIHSSYNVAGMSFNPQELAQAITRRVEEFKIEYAPDLRQSIAASWPQSLDDSMAQRDWGWKARVDLEQMVDDMLRHVQVTEVIH